MTLDRKMQTSFSSQKFCFYYTTVNYGINHGVQFLRSAVVSLGGSVGTAARAVLLPLRALFSLHDMSSPDNIFAWPVICL